MLPKEPGTRIERYLAKLAGEDTEIPSTPITRIECYLDYLVKNGGGSSGGDGTSHNGMFRGKYLGDSLTDAQVAAIKDGSFRDIYIGDYWTMGGVNYRVAGLDLFYNMGETPFVKHHAVIVPDSVMASAKMYNTENPTTSRGYGGSDVKTTVLPTILETVKAAFGASHVLERTTVVSTSVVNGYPENYSWIPTQIDLMSETQIVGSRAFGTMSKNAINLGEHFVMFPLFQLAPRFIVPLREFFGLQDAIDSTSFSGIASGGRVMFMKANAVTGIRPYFCIGDAS